MRKFDECEFDDGGLGLTDERCKKIIERLYLQEFSGNVIKKVVITPQKNGKYMIDYDVQPPPFERIRRITGNPTKKTQKVA